MDDRTEVRMHVKLKNIALKFALPAIMVALSGCASFTPTLSEDTFGNLTGSYCGGTSYRPIQMALQAIEEVAPSAIQAIDGTPPNPKMLNIEMRIGDKWHDHRTTSGTFENGYFVTDRLTTFQSKFWGLLNAFYSGKRLITLDEEGKLHTKQSTWFIGAITVVPFSAIIPPLSLTQTSTLERCDIPEDNIPTHQASVNR